MPTVELTKDNFEETVTGSEIVLIDFWAAWCGPCRMFGPVYEKAAERHPDIVFGKVDTEAQPELAGAFQISSIPTLMAVRDRTVLYSQPGALPPQALEELIGRIRAVDMDDVRRTGRHGLDGSELTPRAPVKHPRKAPWNVGFSGCEERASTASRSAARGRLWGSLPSMAAMPQVLVRAEKTRPPAMPAESELEGRMHEQAEHEAEQDQAAGGEADLAFHAPAGRVSQAAGVCRPWPVGGPGAGAAGEGGGGDALLGQQLAGVLGAGAGGADDEDVTALGGVPDLGQRPPDRGPGGCSGRRAGGRRRTRRACARR